MFTIGLGEYLVLADDACQIHEGFPTPATQELTHDILDFDTGLSPCITLRSRRLLEDVPSMNVSPKHHISRRIRFGLDRFHSRLLTISRSLSLPAGTKMFQFPAFPIARSNCGGEFPLGDPEFLASVRLPQAYRSLARPSSASEPSYPPAGIVANLCATAECSCDVCNS